MRKYVYMFGLFLVSLFVSGCEEELDEGLSLNLYDGEETVQVFEGLDKGDLVSLPSLEKEGYIFLGWKVEETVYYEEYTLEESTNLEAVYEDISEVFTYELVRGDAYLTSYDGDARYLKVPDRIEDYIVRGLKSNVFDGTAVVRLDLPRSLSVIEYKAIAHMEDLSYLGFYGDYLGEIETVLGKEEYDALISEEDVLCEKNVVSERNWTFSGSCPVKEVLGHTDPVEVNGEEIISYQVILDRRYYDDGENSHFISPESFYDLPNLKEVFLPSRYREFQGNIFSLVPSLSKVSFSGESMYESLEDGLYTDDGQYLLYYYPSNITPQISFGNHVLGVDCFAFINDSVIESITIPASFSYQGNELFQFAIQLKALTDVHVDGEGPYYEVDGVLYLELEDPDVHVLTLYPRGRKQEVFHIEEGPTLISSRVFEHNEYLKEVHIASSVEVITLMYIDRLSIERWVLERSVVDTGSITKLVFSSGSDRPIFYVPEDSYEAYLADEFWERFHDYIKPISELD